MPTSSKQSQKASILVNALKAEKAFTPAYKIHIKDIPIIKNILVNDKKNETDITTFYFENMPTSVVIPKITIIKSGKKSF